MMSYSNDQQYDDDVWLQCIDEESGYPYLYNQHTGESKWVEVDEGDQHQQLLVTVWEKYYDNDGYEYFYNPVRSII